MKNAWIIFNREELTQFWVVTGFSYDEAGARAAWEHLSQRLLHRQHRIDIGEYPPEPGDDYDMIRADVIQSD